MSTETVEYTIRVQHEDDGSVWAEVVELPGCFVSGGNLDELLEALQEAVEFYLSDPPRTGVAVELKSIEKLPRKRAMQVDEMRVLVAS